MAFLKKRYVNNREEIDEIVRNYVDMALRKLDQFDDVDVSSVRFRFNRDKEGNLIINPILTRTLKPKKR